MGIIETDRLTKVYSGGVVALSDATIDIERGEIFALLGPNGAGKTTLFKSLLSIVSITRGDAQINGIPVSNPESRVGVGYLPENHRFPEHHTGGSLLRSTAQLYGLNSSASSGRIKTLLELVGMSKWEKVKLRKYSKGMTQRIGLAQALIPDPDILMLDEPTDGVDPVGKIEIRNALKQIKSEGKTIFINSHLLSEVESVADRVAILVGGKVRKVGSVDELTSRKSQFEIEAAFDGSDFDLESIKGRIIAREGNRVVLELVDEEDINSVIDALRSRNISIRSVNPLRISLEESFLETVSEPEETE